jgi:aromatic ring-opening dioxygenase catalytic subunit (LigB family)
MSDSALRRLPTWYIPHGGGPCFFMDWTMGPAATWEPMGEWLRGLGGSLDTIPDALLIVSAHWEAPVVTVGGAIRPSLIYDYYGFPQHTYAIDYAAPGSPGLAREIRGLLDDAGIPTAEDPVRGFDHGVFIPLKLIFPAGTIPVVQLSLHQALDAAMHLDIGHALAPLRERGVLIIGSGMSYHNLPVLMSGAVLIEDSDRFDKWLTESCLMPATARAGRLKNWHAAPAARSAHPREEHLLPLMVAAAAGGDAGGRRIFSDRVMGSTVSAFQFD